MTVSFHYRFKALIVTFLSPLDEITQSLLYFEISHRRLVQYYMCAFELAITLQKKEAATNWISQLEYLHVISQQRQKNQNAGVLPSFEGAE